MNFPKFNYFFSKEINRRVDLLNKINNKKFNKYFYLLVEAVLQTLLEKKKIFWCGNGGSAADCHHFSTELIGRFKRDRQSLPSINLCADTAVVTCISNDFKFENIFSRQLTALGNKNDLLIALSTSGKSKNVLNAINSAKKIKMKTAIFTGNSHKKLSNIIDYPIIINSKKTEIIQEHTYMLCHILCKIVDDAF